MLYLAELTARIWSAEYYLTTCATKLTRPQTIVAGSMGREVSWIRRGRHPFTSSAGFHSLKNPKTFITVRKPYIFGGIQKLCKRLEFLLAYARSGSKSIALSKSRMASSYRPCSSAKVPRAW